MFDHARTVLWTTRSIGKLSRREQRRVKQGVRGDWRLELALYGWSEQRREALLTALEAATGMARAEPVGDGALRLRGSVVGVSLAAAAGHALADWRLLLGDVGVTVDELRDATTGLTVDPDPNPPVVEAAGGLRGLTGRAIGPTLHAMKVATSQLAAVNEIGGPPRDLYVSGEIDGLDGLDSGELLRRTRVRAVDARITDGALPITVHCRESQTPYGALVTAVRTLADLLEVVPAGSGMTFGCNPAWTAPSRA